MTATRDDLYAEPVTRLTPFRFDAQVAAVFPDMIRRSVPGYELVTGLLSLLAARYAQPASRVYDLGCSLGAATLALRGGVPHADCRLVAVDNAAAMVDGCRRNLAASPSPIETEVIHADLREVDITDASLVVLHFTLQFIPPAQRPALLAKIHAGLRPGGVLVLSEKLVFADPSVQAEYTELHHAFKRANGYSELEISQKRTALEKVLEPSSPEQYQEYLHATGFTRSQVWFQCLNFASWLAWK